MFLFKIERNLLDIYNNVDGARARGVRLTRFVFVVKLKAPEHLAEHQTP